jgi:hypothetical protein
MQNLPDKGVSGFLRYLQADHTVTGLTESVLESQGGNEGNGGAFPILGHGLVYGEAGWKV